jgi:hypothetical protein
MDDFQAVTMGEGCCKPFIAGNYAPVEFDGDAVGLHAELFDEIGEGKRAVEVAAGAVDDELHGWGNFRRASGKEASCAPGTGVRVVERGAHALRKCRQPSEVQGAFDCVDVRSARVNFTQDDRVVCDARFLRTGEDARAYIDPA